MQVHRHIASMPAFSNAVVTIGTFDGVHLGHRSIISQMKDVARSVNGETVIISFHPHPRNVVGGRGGNIRLLTTMDERIKLLEALGIDHLVVIPFTDEFASMEAEKYVSEFLVRHFHPHTIIIGYDHRFGQHRAGDYHLLENLSTALGYRVKEIDAQLVDEISISSTRIRQALSACEPDKAAALLGYPYFFEGLVVEGDKKGRTIGYPTANLESTDPEKLLPGNGVYAVSVHINDGEFAQQTFGGMMNIGYRPTVNGQSLRTEVNIFDFDGNLYGNKLNISLAGYLRGEEKFNSLDALKSKLMEDKISAKEMLARKS